MIICIECHLLSNLTRHLRIVLALQVDFHGCRKCGHSCCLVELHCQSLEERAKMSHRNCNTKYSDECRYEVKVIATTIRRQLDHTMQGFPY